MRYYNQAVAKSGEDKKCRSGGIGRRAGFRCLWSQDRVGSSPISCILFYFKCISNPRKSLILRGFSLFIFYYISNSGKICLFFAPRSCFVLKQLYSAENSLRIFSISSTVYTKFISTLSSIS